MFLGLKYSGNLGDFNGPHERSVLFQFRQVEEPLRDETAVPELVDRAQLLVSELVTNAIVHSRCEVEVRLTWADRTLRISVRDVGTEPPACRQLDPESESGRGLQLLHALADRWDHLSVRSGKPEALTKIIWCELDQNPPL